LRDPFDKRTGTPHLNALFGTHRKDGSGSNGGAGYFVALLEAGAVYRQQLPGRLVAPSERGPSGYAFNRYWLVTESPHVIDADELREHACSLAELATADAAGLFAQLRHERGPPS
jgi:hypothetical protein